MNRRRVVITGLGVITPIGNTVEEFWKSLLEGRSGVKTITSFDPTPFSSHIASQVRVFDASAYMGPKEIRKTDRFVHFAIASAKQAMDDSGLDLEKENRDRIGVIIGSGIGGLTTIEVEHNKYVSRGREKGARMISPYLIPMLIVNMGSGYVSIYFNVKGPNTAVATACATGNHSIGDAFRLIQHDEADIMISGGSEAAITEMGFGGFCSMRALSTRNDAPEKASRPFDKDRDGFIMGEGAGVVILEEREHAMKRGARIYCELKGYGMNADGHHITAPDPEGRGASKCMELALKDAGIAPEEVDYINAHGTSTQLNDKVETLAIKNLFGAHARKVAISSTKSVTGHLLGAAGGVEAVASVLAMKNNIIPPTINYETPDPECDLDYTPNKPKSRKVDIAMSNSLGFGGHNAVIVLKRHAA